MVLMVEQFLTVQKMSAINAMATTYLKIVRFDKITTILYDFNRASNRDTGTYCTWTGNKTVTDRVTCFMFIATLLYQSSINRIISKTAPKIIEKFHDQGCVYRRTYDLRP